MNYLPFRSIRVHPRFLSEVRVTRSLVLCVCFVDRCLSFCLFSFDHCVLCSYSIYEFWLPLWYLQTLTSHYNLNYQMKIKNTTVRTVTKYNRKIVEMELKLIPQKLQYIWTKEFKIVDLTVYTYVIPVFELV